MEPIDDETRAIAARMNEVPSDDWRALAAAAEVAPRALEEVLNFDVFDRDEAHQFRLDLDSYRDEIGGLLKEALAELLYADYKADREAGSLIREKLTGEFWETAVRTEPNLRAAVRHAAKQEMRRVPRWA